MEWKKATTNKGIRSASKPSSNNELRTVSKPSSNSLKEFADAVFSLKDSLLKTAISASKNNKTDKKDNSSTTNSNNTATTIKSNTIYVGDSRTVGMCEMYNLCGKNKYIAKTSMGYDWFVSTAINQINNEIKSKEYNIVILMGVNGVGITESSGSSSAKPYYDKVISLAKNEWKKQYIIFVSVNPVNGSNAKKAGMSAEQVAVNSFNKAMKKAITSANLSNLKYCDTNSKLKMSEIDSGDGVHYNEKGYNQIYSIINNDCLK